MQFLKVEGTGNDFILLDRRAEPHAAVEEDLARLRELAPALCDRRRGIGSDGILVVGAPPTPDTDATMWVVNADGSRPEMCGNGLRCVAHFVARQLDRAAVNIATDAGPKACRVEAHREARAQVEVDMGPGRDEGQPALQFDPGHAFRNVSMGNPHTIAFVAEDPEALARSLGPRIERDPAFPARTNVEFARIHADGPRIELWVWERGVGITEACGTGACATACAAVWAGHAATDRPLRVDLPGGPLEIVVPSDRSRGVRMKGPSRFVFRGDLPNA